MSESHYEPEDNTDTQNPTEDDLYSEDEDVEEILEQDDEGELELELEQTDETTYINGMDLTPYVQEQAKIIPQQLSCSVSDRQMRIQLLTSVTRQTRTCVARTAPYRITRVAGLDPSCRHSNAASKDEEDQATKATTATEGRHCSSKVLIRKGDLIAGRVCHYDALECTSRCGDARAVGRSVASRTRTTTPPIAARWQY
jgi:hypothetical protein